MLFFRFCPCLEYLDVGRLLIIDLQFLSKFIIDFEIGCWDDLEDGVAIVLEIEEVFICLVLGSSISESFSC